MGSRLAAHLAKASTVARAQAAFFAQPQLACSYVVNDLWQAHQRLELETDLIGALVLVVEIPPSAQFLG